MPEETFQFESPRLATELYCGQQKCLEAVEQAFDVEVVARDAWIKVIGADPAAVASVGAFFNTLLQGRKQGLNITPLDFGNILESFLESDDDEADDPAEKPVHNLYDKKVVIELKKKSIVPRTLNQKRYVEAMREREIVFGIGPAGTGKTYLAVAIALEALAKGEVERIILTRPAVEAGEALGFLPGDLTEKIKPYLRPLYDAMYEMMGPEYTDKLIERGIIEIAPLAYMRGRTLSRAFIILDEAQNTTPEQMVMFLTRLGEKSRMAITGDITQVDIPNAKNSGLKQAAHVLRKTEGIAFFHFAGSDVVRHYLVQRIITAYERFHQKGMEVDQNR